MKIIQYIILTAIMLASSLVCAQYEYKVNFQHGTIFFDNVNGVEVESYDGHEVIIVTKNSSDKCSSKAEGLRVISGSGNMDNTGIGLNAIVEGETLVISQTINIFDCVDAVVKIPETLKLKYSNNNITACDLIVKGVKREIEISKNYSDVELLNVTGPISVKIVYGDILASFQQLSQLGSISLVSLYGDVDLELNQNSDADLYLKTGYGDIYTNFDIALKKGRKHDNSSYGSIIQGSINKGGIEIIAKATYGDVFIRKN